MALPTASTPGFTAYPGVLYGPDVACSCLARWLYLFRKLCVKRGFGEPIVWQLTGGNTASGGTHSLGGVFDLGGVGNARAMLAREAGAVTWPRPWSGNYHTHGVIDCPHNDPAAYQRTACIVFRCDGLGYRGLQGPDPLPPPSRWRTYDQGIEWMKAQLSIEEDDMFTDQDRKELLYIQDQIKYLADRIAYVSTQVKAVAGLVTSDDSEKDVKLAELKTLLEAQDAGDVAKAVMFDTTVSRADADVPVIQEIADIKTLVLGLTQAVAALPKAEPQPVKPALGIDISGYQSDTLLKEWLPKSEFVFVKATEGKGYDAPAYARQIEMIRAAGLKAGAYHLGWPENGWQADFEHFHRVAGLRVGEASVFDFEPWPWKQPDADPATFPEYIVGFCNAHLEKHGVDPLFYIPDFFIPGIKEHATPEEWERISSLPYFKPGRGGVYVSDPAAGPGETFGFKSLAAWQWTDKPLDQDILYVPWSTIAVKKV